MKLKKIVVAIDNKDIINFLKLQNKIDIVDVKIDNNVEVVGKFELMKFKVNFELELLFNKVENNNVYINISNVKILKINILNSISKKIFSYIINAFTYIEGVSFENEDFKLDILRLINRYYKDQNVVNINEIEIKDVFIKDKEVEVVFGGIDINPEAIVKDSESEKEEYLNEEIVIDVEEINVEDELALTVDEIKKYEKNFNEKSFFDKIKNYGKTAGISAIYAVLILYYTYMDKNVPLKVKAISLGALGYFILPTDLIPDFIIATGFSDDCIALITSIKSIAAYINYDIKSKARNRLNEWFDNIDEKDLEMINSIL